MKRLNNLWQLAQQNAQRAGMGLRAEASAEEATIYLYGVIGGFWGDINDQEFVKMLAGITAGTLHLRINSPGGDVFAARAMMTAISQHPANVIAHVDGLAASAATDIVMACDEAEISQGGRFMIHNAWSLTIGNKADHREMADLLEGIDADIANDYHRRTGQPLDEIRAWMDSETWFNAERAKELGFVDRIAEVSGNAKNAVAWNLSAYANAPKDETPAPGPAAYNRDAIERRMRLVSACGS